MMNWKQLERKQSKPPFSVTYFKNAKCLHQNLWVPDE